MVFLKACRVFFIICVVMALLVGAMVLPRAATASDETQGKDSFTVVVVGDIFLGERAVSFLEEKGVAYPFSAMGGLLRDADLAIGNLESPLTESDEPFMEKKYILKAPPWAVASLKASGIDIFTLANNHMMDYGASALDETLALLDDAGLGHAGAGATLAAARRAAYFEIVVGVDKVKLAVISYSNTFPKEFYAGKERAGTAPGYQKYIKKDVKAARARADIVIVAFHWGAERMRLPKDYQRELARLSIDSGAQIVVGHHPHVIQPVEVYKSGVIFYSLGNFVFGFYSPKEVGGMLANVVFTKQGEGYGIESTRVVPLEVDNRIVQFASRPLEGDGALAAFGRIAEDSATLGTLVEIGGARNGVIVFDEESRRCIIENTRALRATQ
jgi:poly-gamma-glutamate synthesis protein (capsule biosynthesis protein)